MSLIDGMAAGADQQDWPLDRPLLRFGGGDVWTIRDACAGTQIFGDTGSGKTSGSGQAIALAMLRAGFGGLVLTVKSSETDLWRDYMRRVGRSDDLIVFSPEGPYRFNFLEHERNRSSRGGGLTSNLAALFVAAMNIGDAAASSRNRDAFWDQALKQLLSNAIDALRLAEEPMTLANIRRVISSAPIDREDVRDESWREGSYLFQTLVAAESNCTVESDRDDLRVTTEYWLTEFCSMDPRTRGNIVSTFTTTADGFMRGALRELFCTQLNIAPEWTFDGKVIVLDLPAKQFHELGQIAQGLWKLCWQRAVESSGRDDQSRPVFLWADEAQNFISQHEPRFVQTVRSHKAACVYLTQSLSNYLHALGPSSASGVDSFVGIAKTRIFHCNGDVKTNEWAAKTIAAEWRSRMTKTSSDSEKGKRDSTAVTITKEERVLSGEFARLRCGGPPDHQVQAILFQSGRTFRGGDGNIIRLSFNQRPFAEGTEL